MPSRLPKEGRALVEVLCDWLLEHPEYRGEVARLLTQRLGRWWVFVPLLGSSADALQVTGEAVGRRDR